MKKEMQCVFNDNPCWYCGDAYRDMIQRVATGATVHSLNNLVFAIRMACQYKDRELYTRATKKFFATLRSSSRG